MVIKNNPFLSFVLLLLFPISGVILACSGFGIKKNKNNKFIFFIISLFYFFLIIKIPPLGDLYRRYWDILQLQNITSLYEQLSIHPDFLIYLTGFIFNIIGIPFFVLPAVFAFMMAYFLLSTFDNICFFYKKNTTRTRKCCSSLFVIFVVLSTLDILNVILGIRFGMAFILIIYAISLDINNRKILSLLFVIIAISMHFSVIFISCVFFVSKYIKINKKIIPVISLIAFFLSEFLLRKILPNVSIMNIGEYAINGYVDGSWSNIPDNDNTLIVTCVKNILYFLSFIFFVLARNTNDKIDNFISIFISSCFLLGCSFTACERFLSVAGYVLCLRLVASLYMNKENYTSDFMVRLLKFFLLMYALISFLFINIYLQRRTIVLGQIYMEVYTTPFFLLTYGNNDYKKFFSLIDSDGYWIENR